MSSSSISSLARFSRTLPPTVGVVSRLVNLELTANSVCGFGFKAKGYHPTRVSYVEPGGPADSAGVKPGMFSFIFALYLKIILINITSYNMNGKIELLFYITMHVVPGNIPPRFSSNSPKSWRNVSMLLLFVWTMLYYMFLNRYKL